MDVLFAGFPEVRNARHMFMTSVLEQPANPAVIVERYYGLIEAVARAVGVNQWIGPMDVRLVYYPEAAGKLDLAAIADAEERLARYESSKAGPVPMSGADALDAFRTAPRKT